MNYNRTGRKLVFAGEDSKRDQYEDPRDVLDLQISARFLKNRNLEVKFNASDILDQGIIVYRNCATDPDYADRTNLGMDYNTGDWVMSRITKGVNITFGASYRF